MTVAVVFAAIAVALFVGASRLPDPSRPPRFSRRLVVALLVAWPLSVVAFLVALTIYGAQLEHDYPRFVAPQSPILPVTLGAAALTFVVLAVVGRGRGRRRVVAALMAALAAPMLFEFPFDLAVMARTTPPVVPYPGLWRLLFFAPLFAVEWCTIALLLAVPVVRITRWTAIALGSQFMVFAGWASIGLGYPDHLLPHLANVLAKLCAFAVVWTMLLPRAEEGIDRHSKDTATEPTRRLPYGAR